MANQTITLARDSDLETLPDGGAQIYWSNQATWGMCAGAAGVRLQATVLAVTDNTTGQVIGQWSTDGRTWTDFVGPVDGEVEPGNLEPSNGVQSTRQYAGLPWEMAAFVRFGIRVARSTGGQGRLRISCDLIVLDALDGAHLIMAENSPVTAASSTIDGTGQVGEILPTYAYDRGMVCVQRQSMGGLTSVTLIVETCFTDNDAATAAFWLKVGEFPAAFSNAAPVQSIAVEGLAGYTRVRAIAAATNGTATFDVDVFLRPAN